MTKTEGYLEKLKLQLQLLIEKLKTKRALYKADRAEYKQWKAERQTIEKTD